MALDTVQKLSVTFTLNGESVQALVEPRTLLLDYLRNHVEVTSARRGCESGQCGACTVLLDGLAVHSCSVLLVTCRDRSVTTIEAADQDPQLRQLQGAFVDRGAIQCGYCTPGIILSAKALLSEKPQPSDSDIKIALAGNICRCTGYYKIIEAIQDVAKRSVAPGAAGEAAR